MALSTKRPPVLVIGYRRPDKMARMLSQLKNSPTGPVYVFCDGPRDNQDLTACLSVRDLVRRSQLERPTFARFESANLGCRDAVISAIDWVLEENDSAIILEDDCLPHPAFFEFARICLHLFRDDTRVMMVSGLNELGEWKAKEASYFFSTGGTWGWATWLRAWKLLDRDHSLMTSPRARLGVSRVRDQLPERTEQVVQGYWRSKAGLVDTWDYQWALTRMAYGGLSVNPSKNMICNSGIGPSATPTRRVRRLTPKASFVTFPLSHRMLVEPDWAYMKRVFDKQKPSFARKILGKLRRRVLVAINAFPS